jgi:methyltransferase (TIGR00027 family)
LCNDPYGLRFAGRRAQALAHLLERAPAPGRAALRVAMRPVLPGILWVQVRTRVLDDTLLEFVRSGGQQLLLLGAGFDCRALRFGSELSHGTVFEVDHPATQGRKRSVLAEAGASGGAPPRYLAWDFEKNDVAGLPAALGANGHDPTRPTMTIWEGVTMYLTASVIDATVAAVRALSAPGSILAFTYFALRGKEAPRSATPLLDRLVRRVGEPFTFGWDPDELPGWLETRGFELLVDRSFDRLAALLLPRKVAAICKRSSPHVAIARRRAD